MLNIRNYKASEYEMIDSWWKKAEEIGPTRDMLPEESTFILELNGTPWVCMTVYLTNSKEIVWFENLASNPEVSAAGRKEAVNFLIKFCEDFARNKGYKKALAMSATESVTNRYQEIGYFPTCRNITTAIKILRS